ncbi:proteasome subunit alpha, partial [Burkholderia multivorans]
DALAATTTGPLAVDDLEAAVLDREVAGHRKFRRLSDAAVAELRSA